MSADYNVRINLDCRFHFLADYNARLPNQTFSSLQNTRQVTANVLLSYTVHPGTAVYVGYDSDLHNLNPALGVDPNNILRTPNGFINDGRQIFVKIAYLFRL